MSKSSSSEGDHESDTNVSGMRGGNDSGESGTRTSSSWGSDDESTPETYFFAMRGHQDLVKLPMPKPVSLNRNETAFFAEPTEEEATTFYFGFPSSPRLIGRTSIADEPWESIDDQMQRHFAEQREGRRSRCTPFSPRSLTPGPIGFHAIRQIWDAEMHLRFAANLYPLPWRSIDILRMTPAECNIRQVAMYSGTVVVWVGLEDVQIPWTVVSSALVRCRRVLDRANLTDVDVQFRTSHQNSLGGGSPNPTAESSSRVSHDNPSTPLASPLDNIVMRQMEGVYPFSSAIGQPVFPFNAPSMQGSLGLFCWPATNTSSNSMPEAIYAITCRHVGMAEQPNTYFNVTTHPHSSNKDDAARKKLSSNQHAIGIAAQNTAEEFFYKIDYRLKHIAIDFKNVSSSQKAWLEIELSMLTNVAESLADFRNAEGRKIGCVVYSPPIGAMSEPESPRLWTRDLCLVSIDDKKTPRGPAKFPWPANIVDLRVLGAQRGKLDSLLNSFPMDAAIAKQPVRFQDPHGDFFKLSGIIPIKEIMTPPGPTFSRDQDNCIVVGKSGPQTGVTWGWASEVMSIRRTPGDDSTPGFMSLEWAIFGMGKEGPTAKPQPFSAPGDSGSAVFGIDGRLGGFITGGTTSDSGGTHITYASPAAFVIRDIEAALGTKISF